MVSCKLCGLTRTTTSRKENITFHRFPNKNPTLRNKWVKFIEKDLPTNISYCYLCSRHFVSEDFITSCEVRKLKWDAVPTVYFVEMDQSSDDLQHHDPVLPSCSTIPDPVMTLTSRAPDTVLHCTSTVILEPVLPSTSRAPDFVVPSTSKLPDSRLPLTSRVLDPVLSKIASLPYPASCCTSTMMLTSSRIPDCVLPATSRLPDSALSSTSRVLDPVLSITSSLPDPVLGCMSTMIPEPVLPSTLRVPDAVLPATSRLPDSALPSTSRVLDPLLPITSPLTYPVLRYMSPAVPKSKVPCGHCRKQFERLKKINISQKKKLRALQKKSKRQQKKISSIKDLINDLKKRNLLNEENASVLTQNTINFNILHRLIRKCSGQTVRRKIDPEVRKFALTLHFFSPKAYAYTRRKFSNALPHPKTLYNWYKTVDGVPGISGEAIAMLKLKASQKNEKIVCSLMFDEMAIRQQIEWDGTKYHGYVDFGVGGEGDSNQVAKQAIVFMLVAINDNWKIPVAYFLIDSLNSEQKASLLGRVIGAVEDCGLLISSVTFDGCPANLTMSKILGCKIHDPDHIDPSFKINSNQICIFPDPSHMVKLVRNCFGEKKVFIDSDGNVINFDYLVKLNDLQESEGLHLANKMRRSHIHFFKQKMKVRLATQLFSNSVGEALLFCKDVLKLPEFRECEATVKFIKMINDAFDILNSHKLYDYGLRRAVCRDSIDVIEKFASEFITYIRQLRFGNGDLVISSNRKTGFLGFIIDFCTIKNLYKTFINEVDPKLKFIPVYKMSQDHLELFFGTVRSHGGRNNNPSCKQFKSIYKKILIHTEIRDGGMGNCIPLQQITILNDSRQTPEEQINCSVRSNAVLSQDEQSDIPAWLLTDFSLSEYSEHVVIYISGFVSKKLCSTLKCTSCIDLLVEHDKTVLCNSLISTKDKGGLTYPSGDVISTCKIVESTLHQLSKESKTSKVDKAKVTQIVLSKFMFKEHLFSKVHLDDGPQQHELLLLRSIISNFLDIRIHYICKRLSQNDTIRPFYSKLIHFKGQ